MKERKIPGQSGGQDWHLVREDLFVKGYAEHAHLSDRVLRTKIRRKELTFGGNKNLKIYGSLHCSSGKRMRKENRIFFVSETAAIALGYRPCGHCMKQKYREWKKTHGSV